MSQTIKMTTRDGCPYCVSARKWFAERNLTVQDTVLNDNSERQRFYDSIGLVGGQRTVPQIFVDDVRIGGFTELLRSEFAASYK